MDMQAIFGVMIQLFAILVIGFVLNKAGILDAHTNSKLSSLIAKVTAPFLVISSSLSAPTENKGYIIQILIAGFVMYVVLILAGPLLVRLFHFPRSHRYMYECMIVFANVSFMGFSVLQTVVGNLAILYSSMLHFAFNIFIYTYAVWAMERSKEEETGSTEAINTEDTGTGVNQSADNAARAAKKKFSPKDLVTPGIIMTIIALILYLAEIRTDGVVYDVIYMVGNVTAPLSMLILGSTLALYPIKESLCDWHCYLFAVIRLIVIPVVSFGICKLLHVDEFMTQIVTITNAMPVAAMVLMIGNDCKADTRIVIRNVFVSTALSVVTIPVIVGVLL